MKAHYVAVVCVLLFCLSASPAYSANYKITLKCSDILDAAIDSSPSNPYAPDTIQSAEKIYFVTYFITTSAYQRLYTDYHAHNNLNRFIFLEDHLISVTRPVPADSPYATRVGDFTRFHSLDEAMRHIQNICPGTLVHVK